ncbi:MAG: acetamidase/formamidase family protein [Candidatus Brocadiia bacterium]
MEPLDVSSERFVCRLAADAEPALEVEPGTVLRIHCRHACDRLVGLGPERAEAPNPATGPIAVRGAQPGQALRLDVLEVVPESPGHIATAAGGPPRAIPIEEGEALFSSAIRVPIAPMVGVLGVAPGEGSWPTTECGPFGGNLDTKDVAAGATVVLPVYRPGGRFVLGDVHAVMGDGEIGGQGLEVAATVTLRAGLEPAPLAPCVYLVRGGELMTLGTGQTLQEACEAAQRAMVGLLARARVAAEFDAMKLLGLAADLRVGQQCCPTKSARVALPLGLLPAIQA